MSVPATPNRSETFHTRLATTHFHMRTAAIPFRPPPVDIFRSPANDGPAIASGTGLSRGGYRCSRCRHQFALTDSAEVVAAHMELNHYTVQSAASEIAQTPETVLNQNQDAVLTSWATEQPLHGGAGVAREDATKVEGGPGGREDAVVKQAVHSVEGGSIPGGDSISANGVTQRSPSIGGSRSTHTTNRVKQVAAASAQRPQPQTTPHPPSRPGMQSAQIRCVPCARIFSSPGSLAQHLACARQCVPVKSTPSTAGGPTPAHRPTQQKGGQGHSASPLHVRRTDAARIAPTKDPVAKYECYFCSDRFRTFDGRTAHLRSTRHATRDGRIRCPRHGCAEARGGVWDMVRHWKEECRDIVARQDHGGVAPGSAEDKDKDKDLTAAMGRLQA